MQFVCSATWKARLRLSVPDGMPMTSSPENLFSTTCAFTFLPGNQSGLGGVSQVEALMQSMCKRKSGDAMSCTSCHDPHYEPPAEERVAYYREKVSGVSRRSLCGQTPRQPARLHPLSYAGSRQYRRRPHPGHRPPHSPTSGIAARARGRGKLCHGATLGSLSGLARRRARLA